MNISKTLTVLSLAFAVIGGAVVVPSQATEFSPQPKVRPLPFLGHHGHPVGHKPDPKHPPRGF